MSLIEQILVCLCIHLICAYCNRSEDLKDVWHYDVGTTTVNHAAQDANQAHRILQDPQVTRRQSSSKTSGGPQRNKSARIVLGPDDEDDATEDMRCDFKGQHLRVAVSPQPPFVDCLQDMYGEWLCNGSNIELIHVLERRFDFKADWIVIANNHIDDDLTDLKKPWKRPGPPDGGAETGSSSTQAQMSAVAGLVAAGRAMLSANGFMRTIDRSELNLVVSEPFDIFRLHLLLSKSVRNHDHIFIKPFHPKAWLAILCSAVLIVPIFYLINTTSAYHVLEDDELLKRVSLADCWHHYKRKLGAQLANPLKRARSVSLSPSDLSFDREIGTMLMIEPAASVGFANKARAGSTTDGDRFALHNAAAFGFALPVRISRDNVAAKISAINTRRNRRLARHQWAIDRRRIRKQASRRRRSGFFNVAYVIWYAVASLSNQGGETEDLPRANSTRVLIAFWWLYLIVICAIHSGILTAILTFPKQHDFIDDYLNLKPSELVNLHLSVDKQSELAHLLVNSDNLHKSSLQLLKEHDIPVSYVNFQRNRQRILDSIQVGQTALMEEISTINQIITREYYESKRAKCLFKSSRYPIDVIPMSLVLSARMPRSCVRLINATLSRVMQSGLARKWRRKFESPGNNCLNSVEINAGDVDKVELKHIVLAFWLLAGGAGFGLLSLIAEVVWLFTIGDEDDDDSNSLSGMSLATCSLSSLTLSSSGSSIETSSSDDSDRVRLGFRRALMPPDNQLSTIRSLKAKHLHVGTLIRKTKRNQKRRLVRTRHRQRQTPKIIFTVDVDRDEHDDRSQNEDHPVIVDEADGLKEVSEFHARRLREKRHRRAAREAERRARRIQRTVELVKRVHGGHIYSDRLKKRVRRLSHSLAGRFSLTTPHPKQQDTITIGEGSSRPRKRGVSVHYGAANCRVAPSKSYS